MSNNSIYSFSPTTIKLDKKCVLGVFYIKLCRGLAGKFRKKQLEIT
jgi:hypothetical protein